MNYSILAGRTVAPRSSTVLGADYRALAPRTAHRDPDVALVLAATRAVRRGAKVHPNRIAPLRVILGEIAESVGADPALTDKLSVQMFQTGLRTLPKDKQLPEFVAVTKAIDKQTNAFGEYGPLTKKAAAKFNSVYNVSDAGSDITQGTLTMLSMMTTKLSPSEEAKQEAERVVDVKTQAATAVASKAQVVDDQVKAATTTPELKTATAATTAVAQQVVATAPTPELKQEAVAAQQKAVEAQKAVEQAQTPAQMEKAIEKSKEASTEVERVADKVLVSVGGGSAKQVAVAVALGIAVLGLGGVIYLAATAKMVWAGAALVLTAGAAVGGYAALAAAGKGTRA